QSGFDHKMFWSKCGGHDHTVLVMRIRGTNEITGGYNPLEWSMKQNGYMRTENSFLFSLKNGKQKSIVSRVRKDKVDEAIYICRSHGPKFGKRDMFMGKTFNSVEKNDQCKCKFKNYQVKIRSTKKFSIDEYEVFQVFRKFDMYPPSSQ
ncbi:7696_t:CDS:1, partial [Acaulospora morrowiae]